MLLGVGDADAGGPLVPQHAAGMLGCGLHQLRGDLIVVLSDDDGGELPRQQVRDVQ